MAERVSNGDCLSPLRESADVILERHNIKIEGAVKTEEKAALARLIQGLEKLGPGNFKYHRGARFIYRTGRLRSRFNGKAIEINPGEQNIHSLRDKSLGGTNNVGLHAHELGHFVGFKGLYPKYFAAVPDKNRCLVSQYAKTNRNEEFAEAFAAFLMDPEHLKNGGGGCAQASRFFAEIFGIKEMVERPCPPVQTAESSKLSS